jgi:hypothetical protein
VRSRRGAIGGKSCLSSGSLGDRYGQPPYVGGAAGRPIVTSGNRSFATALISRSFRTPVAAVGGKKVLVKRFSGRSGGQPPCVGGEVAPSAFADECKYNRRYSGADLARAGSRVTERA